MHAQHADDVTRRYIDAINTLDIAQPCGWVLQAADVYTYTRRYNDACLLYTQLAWLSALNDLRSMACVNTQRPHKDVHND